MRTRFVVPLAAGFLAALAIVSFPASAADTNVAAQSVTYSWSPSSITINVGDSVTWSTDGIYPHNVCVQKPGTTGTTCDEFRNGDPSTSWSSYTNTHTFTAPGTYKFYCEEHKSLGMTGTITVQGSSTGTGTTVSTGPTSTEPTVTTTAPTETTPADTTPPQFTSKIKRRSSRKSVVLDFGSSEDATLSAKVFRRPPHAHSFARVGSASLSVHQGHDVVTLPRKASGSLRSGTYDVKLQLVDAAGNRSATKTLEFKLA